MKHVTKSTIVKRTRLSLILLGVFAVLLTVSIILGVVISNKEPEQTDNTQSEIELMPGEDMKYNYPVVYSEVADEKMQTISVKNKTGEYAFRRDNGVFMLYYRDSNGDMQVFYPDIMGEDLGFKYSSLYSIETGDSFQAITKLAYLCMALEAPYFSERIVLSEDEAERSKELEIYGLTENEVQTVTFSYLDENKETKYHKLRIGNPSINEAGHYFMVDDREYVYCSSNSYFSYALGDYASFIKAILVAEGLSYDNGFGPYLTSNYYQWENERYEGAKKDDPDSVGATLLPDPSKTENEISAIIYTDIIYPSDEEGNDGGYVKEDYSEMEINLTQMLKDEAYHSLINALIGKGVGERDGVFAQDIIASVISQSLRIDFGDLAVKNYEYTITAVEAIITDAADITAMGTAVSGHTKIKVAYAAKADGKAISTATMHAVIDLEDALIPQEAREALSAASIGPLSTPVKFSVDYTKENTYSQRVRYLVTEITTIYDSEGNEISTVAADSAVSFRYCFEIDGVRTEEEIYLLDLAKDDEGVDVMRELLIGRQKEKNIALVISEETAYYEALYDFLTYSVAKIDSYVDSRLVVAFRFQNASERDPYYGESIYENLMQGKYSLYGLNAMSCESVAKVLGGISAESSTGSADGLFGDKALALGITPEVKEKYGLYAYTIYFELPRGIEVYSSTSGEIDSSDEIDDYYAYATLGTYLYISEVDPVTNTRYVGSDLYDVVTEIPADKFAFLEYDFESFWARKNLVLMDINYIDEIKLEFNMADLKGNYTFDLNHDAVYVNGNQLSYEKPDESGWGVYNLINATVFYGDNCTSNALIEYAKEKGYTGNSVELSELYKYVYLDQYKGTSQYNEALAEYNKNLYLEAKYDSLGTAYFKEAIRALFLTSYTGVMSDDEQAAAMTEDKLLMRMSFKLLGTTANASGYSYVYSFYRADDRRILVSIHQADENGNIKIQPVSDLYISSFAYNKIVNIFVGVLNAQKVSPDVAYPDYAIKKEVE